MKAGFTTSMFEIEHGQHEMKTHRKSKTRPLHPEKNAIQFMKLPPVSCCYSASFESFIQCIMVHQWKLGPFHWDILPG
jgi:hypothetical protein